MLPGIAVDGRNDTIPANYGRCDSCSVMKEALCLLADFIRVLRLAGLPQENLFYFLVVKRESSGGVCQKLTD
jgi:hypothetical protein